MQKLILISIAVCLLVPATASARGRAVTPSEAKQYATATVAPALSKEIGYLATSKVAKCSRLNSGDALCAVKSDVSGIGIYCVTLVDVYRHSGGSLGWRDLDAYCSTDELD